MVEFKAIETFAVVTRLGSFRRTADQMHTTQPAISQRIAQLERDLGTKLLSRDRRQVVPTPQGRQLLEYADRLIRLRDEMIRTVAGAAAVSGILRIGTSETIVHTWLSTLVRRASQKFPKLSLEIEVDISPRLLERLLSRELDLAFMVGPIATPEISSRPLADVPVAFIASPAIRWSATPVPVDELARWPIVTFSRRTKPFTAIESLFKGVERSAVRLHASASLATAVRMALDGTCIAAIPPAIVSDHLKRGELRVVKAAPELPSLEFVASWCTDNSTLAIDALVDMAAAVAQGPGEKQSTRRR